MYDQINTNAQAILKNIPVYHVTEYDWLIQNLDQCATSKYQARYKKYWRLGPARLCANYIDTYFAALAAARMNPPCVADLARSLFNTPTHMSGRKSLQYSFATKLVHMISPTLPIYDTLVSSFYLFRQPPGTLSIDQRAGVLREFHLFLQKEYDRVLKRNLLAPAIMCFRQLLKPQSFTDEKVIDSLIWAFVANFRDGGSTKGLYGLNA